jgi:hypothetical protein
MKYELIATSLLIGGEVSENEIQEITMININ